MQLTKFSRLVLMNTSILTRAGEYRYSPIDVESAIELIAKFQQEGKTILSAVGHQGTADIMSEILGISVANARLSVQQELTDLVLVFKLRSRPPEGTILSREEIERYGYDFFLLEKLT